MGICLDDDIDDIVIHTGVASNKYKMFVEAKKIIRVRIGQIKKLKKNIALILNYSRQCRESG